MKIGIIKMKNEILKLIDKCINEYGLITKIGNKFNNVFRHYSEYKQWLKENIGEYDLIEQLYLLKYDLEKPLCKQCKERETKFINFVKGYKDCCCTKCTNLFKYRSYKYKSSS